MQDLEFYDLGEGIVIVNVTDIDEISDVIKQMSAQYTWDLIEFTWTPPEESAEGPTEWLNLTGARRLEAAA